MTDALNPSPWLPVPETPTPGVAPFDGEWYTVAWANESSWIGRWHNDRWRPIEGFALSPPTHYMPLPEPPEDEG